MIFFFFVNFGFFFYFVVDEIAKQLQLSGAKLIIGLAERFDVLRAACDKVNRPIQIICLKTDPNQSLSNGVIDFAQLFNPAGKLWY